MSIGANATHEQVNTTCLLNSFLIVLTFCLQILGITIEDMDILFLDINVAKEVVPHKVMVALGMLLGKVYILSILNVMTFWKDTLPALFRAISSLYIPKGELPVGQPNLNGLSAVGFASLIHLAHS